MMHIDDYNYFIPRDDTIRCVFAFYEVLEANELSPTAATSNISSTFWGAL